MAGNVLTICNVHIHQILNWHMSTGEYVWLEEKYIQEMQNFIDCVTE